MYYNILNFKAVYNDKFSMCILRTFFSITQRFTMNIFGCMHISVNLKQPAITNSSDAQIILALDYEKGLHAM